MLYFVNYLCNTARNAVFLWVSVKILDSTVFWPCILDVSVWLTPKSSCTILIRRNLCLSFDRTVVEYDSVLEDLHVDCNMDVMDDTGSSKKNSAAMEEHGKYALSFLPTQIPHLAVCVLLQCLVQT